MDSALAMGRPGGSSSVFHDGLGDRRRVTDSTGTELVERLCLRAELTNVPSFEFALRERASRLASFRHPCFAAVRSIDRLNDATSTLAVVSEAVRGVRLSALLAKAGRPAIDINASIHLIRQLVSAIAILHESAPDVAHGAIAPERLVITPNARVIVVEHVLGAALEQLRYSRDQYWSDLRVAVPASTMAVSHLDQRADVVQIGIVFLALILGRPLDDNEYPTLIADVLASAQALSANNEREPLPAGLRAWLTRMLQFDPLRSFDTAVEARDELERVLSDEEDEVSEELVTEPGRPVTPQAPEPATHASAPPRPPVQASTPTPPSHTPTPPRPQPAPTAVRSEAAAVSVSPPKAAALPAPPPAAASTPVPSPAGASRGTPTMTSPASTPLLDPTKLPEPIEPAFLMEEPDAPSRWAAFAGAVRRRGRAAATAVVAAIVLATGGFAAKRYVFGQPAAPVNGSLSVTSVPAGAQVLVDGEVRGLAPVTLSVAPGPHALELRGAGEPLKIPITVAAGQQLSQYVELAKSVAAFGQLQVRTEPTGALVTVDGIARGRSPVMVDTLAAGEHAVVLQSDLATVKQSVTIGAGQTASLVVPLVAAEGAPVSGWIAVAAPVELQVFENKRLLGTSQADRLMVSAGRHDIELVNDTLGYRVVRTVQVAPGKLTSMTLNWPTGSAALNALPWAEVFVDDKRIGETPIGNLSLPIGPHEVLFRHPDLGEQRQAFTVSLKSPVRVSADMRKKP
jgi:serine/threonine protein kinase